MTDSNLYFISQDEIIWQRPYESLKDIQYSNGKYIYYIATHWKLSLMMEI